ncbi:MAG: hypothetical protein HW400_459 [Candidatus Levybacteria bacterium]|nr:hypothetical protein [Candidatus Levybacteria bacterium]
MAEIQNSPDGGVDSQGKTQNKLLGNKSSHRFQSFAWTSSELIVQRPEVVGLENLEKIPKGVNPVIAGSHLRTDATLQIIARELDKTIFMMWTIRPRRE